MKKVYGIVLLGFVSIGGNYAWADEALWQTQRLLSDPKERSKAIENDAEAQAADQALKNLAGTSERSEQMYELSSQIFEKLVSEAQGDPEALQKILLEAKNNPAQFLENLGPEEQKRIRGLAQEIERAQGKKGKSLP